MSRVRILTAIGTALAGLTVLAASAGGAAVPEKPAITTDILAWSTSTSATFELSGSAGTASFSCRLDGGGDTWAPCASPVSYTSLAEGAHTFQVRALDGSGGQSPPSTFAWTIDATAPALPGDVIAEAVSPAGAIVSFAATDNLDPAPALACTHASGSTFPLGETTVTCAAADAAGNASGDGSFTVTVRDTTPPTLDSHPDVIAAQQSPQGAVVDYALPAARDAADPSPVVQCHPTPGSPFPLGDTEVSCVATDAAGLSSAAEAFTVIVQAGPTPAKPGITTTVPRLSKRADAEFELDVEAGVVTECRLDGPLGDGAFEPCSGVKSYSGLADGAYLFTVQVTNSIGNVSQASYDWTVDRTPPAEVAGFGARASHRRVALAWTTPIDVDFDRVRIWRKRGAAGGWKRVADRLAAASFVDRTVLNHVLYRYRIASIDRAGNVSPVATVTAWPTPIAVPRYGAVVHSPPLIDWRSVPGATYYNLQVWRDGRKILSVWPLRSQYRLRSAWTFRGTRFSLTQGRLAVYLWPGYGSKAAVRYGPLYGRTSFTIG
ncbi:MAG TPA: HYR domain-containing protein [Gaiellaceae bacterium]|nr:HYR domain-containing protein [Gaiellaceae bacterium]